MNRTQLAALVSLAATIAVLQGCAGTGGMPAAQGQSPAYRDGYRDGCASGRASQGSPTDFYRKNTSEYDTNKDYAQAWSDAFRKCSYEQSQKMAAGNGR